jgi:isoleucyl-tRNA synthetase
MDYKETINLPKTDFPMEARLTELEPKIRAFWDRIDIYQKARQARKGAPKFVLHDGPPYANGDVHVGTGQNKILKDIIDRYKIMQGFDVPYVPGWDCHGLPIEHEVVKRLGPEAKDISKGRIRQLCQEFALKYIDIQRNQFKGLGILGDWGRPYLTLDPSYELSIIELFEDLVNKGYIYKRKKPVHWCMHCQTTLAGYEVEYHPQPSPSIYVKFKMDSDPSEAFPDFKGERPYILIWTTTPWTLPANVAVALHPDFEYVLAQIKGEYLILGEAVLERLSRFWGTDCRVICSSPGKRLEGLRYLHPLLKRECSVVLADYVRLEDGTGCVHIAPGHGEEDYETGIQYSLPVISPVDSIGSFTPEAGEFSGQNVFDANPRICEVLRAKGLLLFEEEISHEYPCCWRCKSPLIFRATEQWFISLDHNEARKRSLEQIEKTRWIPQWGKMRIGGMVQERPDWCISRQRSWGVPIPAFYCEACNELLLNTESLSAVKRLFERGGANSWFTTEPKDILPPMKCQRCGNTSFRKEEDIFDVWFESAASHRAVCIKHPDLCFPADLYLEGTDQHRGWFQVSLLASVLSQGIAPFKTVLTHGFVVDARTGDKLSKSGFLIPVDQIVTRLGADILRLWISSIDFTDDMPMSWEVLQERCEPYKKIRNTFRFMLGNLYDFDPSKDRIAYDDLLEIDRWAVYELERLKKAVTDANERFEFFKGYHLMYDFCVVQLSAIYFAILKDRLYTWDKSSLGRRSAQTVLYDTLVALTKMFAPILIHTMEEVWGYITQRETESVTLARWPVIRSDLLKDQNLAQRWGRLFKVRAEVYKGLERLRSEKLIGSSLGACVRLYSSIPELQALLKETEGILPEFFIVSHVEVLDTPPEESSESPEFKGLWIQSQPYRYSKCSRCWKLSPSVGKDHTYPDICACCADIVRRGV